MAITWEWSEKCGNATFEDINGNHTTYDVDLYVGNCFLIMIKEFTEDGVDRYELHSFFCDEEHMKRCMEDNIFTKYDRLTKISINKAKCRNYKKIVNLLVEYMDDISIEIYKEGEQTWAEYKDPRPTIPDIRMREIAERAIDAIVENNDYWEEDLEEFGIDLTDDEREYFNLPLKEDEEDE